MIFESVVNDAQVTILLEKEDGYLCEDDLNSQIVEFVEDIFNKVQFLKSHGGEKLFIKIFLSDCDLESAVMVTNGVKSGLLEICKDYNPTNSNN